MGFVNQFHPFRDQLVHQNHVPIPVEVVCSEQGLDSIRQIFLGIVLAVVAH